VAIKKGQSGNPLGCHPVKSLKEYAKEYLAGLTDEERLAYFEGMNKADIWKMAEGNPANHTDLTSGGEPLTIDFDPSFDATTRKAEGDSQ
jgi:hypothetical protein